MDKIRKMKRHSRQQVAHYCQVPVELIKKLETHKIVYLDFLQWVMLTAYYGRILLEIPFSVHKLEFPVAEVYFMYIRNGEPVQFAAKEARKLLCKESEC